MSRFTIEHVLCKRGAWLKGTSGDERAAIARAHLSRQIGAQYGNFKAMRADLLRIEFAASPETCAEQAIHGQVVGWEVKGFTGENEFDLIMRRGDELSFVSCKALRSKLDINDKKNRNRLMAAVHEADNLADHFGERGEKVAVLVTTDLYDEVRDTARYHALVCESAGLDVHLIALEELGQDRSAVAFQNILSNVAG